MREKSVFVLLNECELVNTDIIIIIISGMYH